MARFTIPMLKKQAMGTYALFRLVSMIMVPGASPGNGTYPSLCSRRLTRVSALNIKISPVSTIFSVGATHKTTATTIGSRLKIAIAHATTGHLSSFEYMPGYMIMICCGSFRTAWFTVSRRILPRALIWTGRPGCRFPWGRLPCN